MSTAAKSLSPRTDRSDNTAQKSTNTVDHAIAITLQAQSRAVGTNASLAAYKRTAPDGAPYDLVPYEHVRFSAEHAEVIHHCNSQRVRRMAFVTESCARLADQLVLEARRVPLSAVPETRRVMETERDYMVQLCAYPRGGSNTQALVRYARDDSSNDGSLAVLQRLIQEATENTVTSI